MTTTHIEVMQLIVGYTFVGVFLATSVAAVRDMLRGDARSRKYLRVMLIGEVVAASVALAAGWIKFDPTVKIDPALPQSLQGFVKSIAEGRNFKRCDELDQCAGDSQVLACITSSDLPSEVPAGTVLWNSAPTAGSATDQRGIRYAPWINEQCQLRGKPLQGEGWSASIGTCGTGQGTGRQRCSAVLVVSP